MTTREKTVKEKTINSGNRGNHLEGKKVSQEILEEENDYRVTRTEW